jgi:UDP-2,4-diacetamido-2,4,6-trideoxy-beta-L-altropyranose hydrolase
MENILFRVDASETLGKGHLSRCLNLANKLLNERNSIYFITNTLSSSNSNLIRGFGFKHIEISKNSNDNGLDETLEITKKLGSVGSIVIDHYQIGFEWEKRVSFLIPRLVVIDDLANRAHHCHYLIDQTLGRLKSDYTKLVASDCKLLLGSEYSLISRDYTMLREKSIEKRQHTDQLNKILVAFGGGDPSIALLKVSDDLALLEKKYTIYFVTRSTMDAKDELMAKLNNTHHDVKVFTDISDLSELVYMSDLSVGAGGISSYERCCLGLPTVLIKLADNQSGNASSLQSAGAVYYLGSICDIVRGAIAKAINNIMSNYDFWKSISDKSILVCDGQGVSNIARIIYGE